MATPEKTIWEIEPHTVAKHKILEHYLQAWFPILGKYSGRIVYLDGFCGPGCYSGGEAGSPIVALKTAIDHRGIACKDLVFIFVDERSDRIDNLKGEIEKLHVPKHFTIYPEEGEFETVVGNILETLDHQNANLAPTFTFIDPFGFSGVPYAIVKRLLKHPKSEVLVTFMVDSMNRFLGSPQEEVTEHIVGFFGTEKVLEIAAMKEDRKSNLIAFYEQRLRELAKYVRIFEMRNKDDRLIYELVFATNNPLGNLKMKEAMWKVDGDGDFRYSDATIQSQIVFFQVDQAKPLFLILKQTFAGKVIAVSELRRFVRDDTQFIDKHLRQALEYGERQSLLTIEPLKMDGKKRIKSTFPDEVILKFN